MVTHVASGTGSLQRSVILAHLLRQPDSQAKCTAVAPAISARSAAEFHVADTALDAHDITEPDHAMFVHFASVQESAASAELAQVGKSGAITQRHGTLPRQKKVPAAPGPVIGHDNGAIAGSARLRGKRLARAQSVP